MWPWSKITRLALRQSQLEKINAESFKQVNELYAENLRLKKELAAKDEMLSTAVLRDPSTGRLLSKSKQATN